MLYVCVCVYICMCIYVYGINPRKASIKFKLTNLWITGFVFLNLLFIYFLKIEFIGVTLVNKIVWVSGAQFYNASSVYFIVCLPPQVKSFSISIHPPPTIISPTPATRFPLVVTIFLDDSIFDNSFLHQFLSF